MTAIKNSEVLPTPKALAEKAATLFIQNAHSAIQNSGKFTVVLSGGKTPKEMYHILSERFRDDVDWNKVYVFWGDERLVPKNDPESNYRLAREEFLGKVAIPPANIFRVPTEAGDPRTVAQEYNKVLHQFFGESEPTPHFDLIFLGMGADGHTASLFPDSNYISESHDSKNLVIAPKVDHLKGFRISLTLRVFNSAKHVIFLVAGSDKATTIKKIFKEGLKYPAAQVEPSHGELLWLLDKEAAYYL